MYHDFFLGGGGCLLATVKTTLCPYCKELWVLESVKFSEVCTPRNDSSQEQGSPTFSCIVFFFFFFLFFYILFLFFVIIFTFFSSTFWSSSFPFYTSSCSSSSSLFSFCYCGCSSSSFSSCSSTVSSSTSSSFLFYLGCLLLLMQFWSENN